MKFRENRYVMDDMGFMGTYKKVWKDWVVELAAGIAFLIVLAEIFISWMMLG